MHNTRNAKHFTKAALSCHAIFSVHNESDVAALHSRTRAPFDALTHRRRDTRREVTLVVIAQKLDRRRFIKLD